MPLKSRAGERAKPTRQRRASVICTLIARVKYELLGKLHTFAREL